VRKISSDSYSSFVEDSNIGVVDIGRYMDYTAKADNLEEGFSAIVHSYSYTSLRHFDPDNDSKV
jgi:hypothetical protein